MSTITTIEAVDIIADSRAVINTNFSNLNTDKVETLDDLGITVTASDINTVVTRNLTLPSGLIMAWATDTAPTGWRLCNGAEISRTTYADLFAVIGTTYGVGNGTTTFNVPNFAGRVIVGYDSAQTEFDTLGETGGSKTHTLTTAQIPSHAHLTPGTGVLASEQNNGGDSTATNRTSTQSSSGVTRYQNTDTTGGGEAHNNLQPYVTLNYIIKE